MATVLMNGAGASAADPILRNLGIEIVLGTDSFDVTEVVDAWVDGATGFPGTNSVKGSLSPAATVVILGLSGSYDDTTKRYDLGSTTGVSVGDYVYLDHASLTAGFYRIASIPVAGFVTVEANPLDGAGDQTNIAFQVAWRYEGVVGTAPVESDSTGIRNFVKFQAEDTDDNAAQREDDFYARDAPAGSAFIAIDGQDYTGQTTSDPTPSLAILAGWASKGGVSHVALGNHSVSAANDFTFGDDTTAEKTLAAAEGSGLKATGDGLKRGALLLRSKSGGVTYSVDISITVDTAAPTLLVSLYGR